MRATSKHSVRHATLERVFVKVQGLANINEKSHGDRCRVFQN